MDRSPPPASSLEIEVKIPVPSLDAVRHRLEELRVPRSAKKVEKDRYYNHPDRDFAVTDEALRIRVTADECKLYYKGPRVPGLSMKAREEISVRIGAQKPMETILERLGFTPVRVVEKTRELYPFRQTLVCLDQVGGLGDFVEIEIQGDIGDRDPEDILSEVKKILDIRGEHIPESYLEMLLSKDSSSR